MFECVSNWSRWANESAPVKAWAKWFTACIQVIKGLALPCPARTVSALPDPPQPSRGYSAGGQPKLSLWRHSQPLGACRQPERSGGVGRGHNVSHFGNVFCMSAAAELEDVCWAASVLFYIVCVRVHLKGCNLTHFLFYFFKSTRGYIWVELI